MVTKHLTDDEVQQYAIDRLDCEKGIAEHIHFCEECRAKAEVYQLMIVGIREQPQPAFDFDLSRAVFERIPIRVARPVNDKLLVWTFIVIGVGLIGTVFYFFRSYLGSMFKGVTLMSMYLMGISAITVLAWVFVEMYKKYQKEMRVLDLY